MLKKVKDGILQVLIFIALAASGKSESLKFIKMMSSELRRRLHLGGNLVILDDFPYVDLMRRVDEILVKIGLPPVFFLDPRKGFSEPAITWLLLIELLNRDYNMLVRDGGLLDTEKAGIYFLRAIDVFRHDLGAPPLFTRINSGVALEHIGERNLDRILMAIQEQATKVATDRNSQILNVDFSDMTVLFEFARGGVYGAKDFPCGYAHSLSAMDPEILDIATMLYLEVLPEQAALKNFLRADPNDPSSILGHCVPYEVMYKDYGGDDAKKILNESDRAGYVKVPTMLGPIYVPMSVLDNRKDLTSFVRSKRNAKRTFEQLPQKKSRVLFRALESATDELWKNHLVRIA